MAPRPRTAADPPAGHPLDGMQDSSGRPSGTLPQAFLGWALVLGIALALRLSTALSSSLRLDDFHSLHHARADGWRTFFETLRLDNHPPLSFAILAGFRRLFGESALALRLPALCFGMLHVVLAGRLAGAFGGRRLQLTAAGFVAVSSLALEQATSLRMYAPLGVAVTGLTIALIGAVRGRASVLAIAGWSVLGLHVHYHFVHALVSLGLGLLVAALLDRETRRAWRAITSGFALAALASLPWYATGFRWQLGHELAPGGSFVSVERLASSFVHLLVHELRVAPAALHPILAGCGLLATALAGIGWLCGAFAVPPAAREASSTRLGRGPWILLGAAAFALPLWSALVAFLVPRAGFEWRYVVGAIAPFGVCFALGAFGVRSPLRLSLARSAAGAACLIGALVLCVFHTRDRGRENYKDAVGWIVSNANESDGLLAADWQPRLFPHGVGWSYYAERSSAERDLPSALEHEDDFRLTTPSRLGNHARVFVLLRSIPDGVPMLSTLRSTYRNEEKQRFGEAIWVLAFDERADTVSDG